MIPPEATTRGRSQQALILKTIEKKIQHCLLDPRPRRMIHRVTTPCGRGRIAIRVGGSLPHQEISGSPDYDMIETYQVWQERTSDASAATHRLKSIYESDGDAVKGPRSDEGYWR